MPAHHPVLFFFFFLNFSPRFVSGALHCTVITHDIICWRYVLGESSPPSSCESIGSPLICPSSIFTERFWCSLNWWWRIAAVLWVSGDFVCLALKLFHSCSLLQELPGPFLFLSSLVDIIQQSPQRTEEITELFIPSGKGNNLWRDCKKSGLGDFRKRKPFPFWVA